MHQIQDEMVIDYTDSDFSGSVDRRSSLTGYVFTLYGTAINWKSILQPMVALYTTEPKYIAITEAVKEGLWMRGFMRDLGLTQEVMEVYCNSQSVVHLTKHQVFNEMSKHIDIRKN